MIAGFFSWKLRQAKNDVETTKKVFIVRININYRIIFELAHSMIVSWAVTWEGDAFGRGSLYPSQILFFNAQPSYSCIAFNCNKEVFISEMCDWTKYRHSATNHPKRYRSGCCTINLHFIALNYKTTGISFHFTWEFLPEDLFARRNPAGKCELGDR